MTADPDALALAPVEAPPPGFIARHAFPILLLGLLSTAFSPIFVRLSEVGPIATGMNRLALPLPLFFAVLWWRPQDRIPLGTPTGKRDFWLVVLSGVFFAGDMVLWNSSIMLTTVTNAAVLANITPVYVVLGAWLLFKEKPGGIFVVGMAVALVGSALMMRESLSVAGRSVTGDVLAMCAAAFYAGYVLTLSRVRKRVSIVPVMAIGCVVSAIILFTLAAFTEEQLWPRTMNGWLVAAAMVLLVQIGGQMFIAMSLAHVPPGLVAMMFLLQPAIPGAVAWLMFGEAVTWTQVAGALALLIGLEVSRRATPKKD